MRRVFLGTFVSICALTLFAQIPEQNVNMVAGTGWPHGDPFLQRQNEPSVAVSTRNPLHLLAGANDYRSVDIPFETPAGPDNEERGDAWVGVFKSRNGGQTWWSDLLPGYPQDSASTSPIHGFQAAADPVVRAGANGMFYFSGIVLNRGTNPLGAIFVSRFIDNNNTENGDPIQYLGTNVIDQGTPGSFIDKPWLAVAPGTGQCTVNGQTFAAQNVYLAYTEFVGSGNNLHTKLMFTRSTDCGATWGPATKLSEEQTISQGAMIAVAPNGNIYVAWRRFKTSLQPNAILLSKSTDGGKLFTKGAEVVEIDPFEQATTHLSIRTNAYPAIATDESSNVYIVWSERNAQLSDPTQTGRIKMTTSADGVSWSKPLFVDPSVQGHQFMPAIAVAGGKVVVAYYDLRDTDTRGLYSPLGGGHYLESRDPIGDLPSNPGLVFTPYLLDVSGHRRHTLDLRAAQFNTGVMPIPQGFTRVSQYVFGTRPTPGNTLIEQLQFNPPNLPMFRNGTVPFLGDYIDLSGYSPKKSPVFHAVWTDNRDVRPPKDGNWANYTPPSTALAKLSLFNGQATTPCQSGQSGMRNQNIYTARLTNGVFAGSPGNAKQLGKIQRAFAIFVQNAEATDKTYRLTIANQPVGGVASFSQLAVVPGANASIDVPIPARSSATRTVFVTSTLPHSSVNVDVVEIAGIGGTPLSGGLTTQVVINPDVSNPDVSNPDVSNPDVSNPDVSNPDVSNPDVSNAEVYNPDVSNPDVSNPDVSNPDVSNPDVSNPDVSNPDVSNPDVSNPDVSNPDVSNPDVSNPDVSNASITDTTWTTHNTGNTTSGYTIKLATNAPLPDPAKVKMQLIVHRVYQTPIANNEGGFSGCTLTKQKHSQLITNILNPQFSSFGQLMTSDPTAASLWLAPGDAARITLRVYGTGGATFDAANLITPVVISEAVNTTDLGNGGTPPVALAVVASQIPSALVGMPFTTSFSAIGGVPPYTWSVAGAPGFAINSNGVLTGTFATTGSFPMTITVADSAVPKPHVATRDIVVNVHGFIVTGRLHFNGAAVTPTTPPQFFVRNETTFQQQPATVTWNGGSTFTIGGLPPGTYGVEVASQENASALFYPGSFYSFTVFDAATASQNGFDVTMLKVIHVTVPADNARSLGAFACPPLLAFATPDPQQFTWDAIPVASSYRWQITKWSCKNGSGTPVASGSSEVPSTTLQTPLAATNADEYYTFTITAFDGPIPVGEIMTNGDGWHGWDLRFTVNTIVPLLKSVAAGFGQLEVFAVSGLFTTDGASVHFIDHNGTGADGFLFHSPSTPSRLYVRLPAGLANGPLTATVNFNASPVASTQITQSTTPGTPIIQAIRLVTPTPTPSACATNLFPNPTTDIIAGDGIAVSAFGTDTTGAEVQFTQNGFVTTVNAETCALDSASIGEATVVVVPSNLNAGPAQIMIRTTVNGVTSAWSQPVTVNVTLPIA